MLCSKFCYAYFSKKLSFISLAEFYLSLCRKPFCYTAVVVIVIEPLWFFLSLKP